MSASKLVFCDAVGVYSLHNQGRCRHCITYIIARYSDDGTVVDILKAMRHNIILEGLSEGRDFVWEGSTIIAFRRKRDASAFVMFVA